MDFNSVLMDLGISFLFVALRDSIKNPSSKAKIKPIVVKIASMAIAIFGEDEIMARVPDAKKNLGIS